MNPKTVKQALLHPAIHWVGDGFPVRSVLSPRIHARAMDPFLLLDYAGPHEFGPADQPRGVDRHPHKGFETVTLALQGEIEHRDSNGGHGIIHTGDVQWMTAASGVIHEEFHSEAFTRTGGTLEMVQLWVNLPAKFKGEPPRYQAITSDTIPIVRPEGGRVRVSVIAGVLLGAVGPAQTFTRVGLWQVNFDEPGRVKLPITEGDSAGVLGLGGTIAVADDVSSAGPTLLERGDFAVLSHEGDTVALEAKTEGSVLILSGEPIREPIAAYGPFVMNTQSEIRDALDALVSMQD